MQPDLKSWKRESCKQLLERFAGGQGESSVQFNMRTDTIRNGLKKAVVNKVHSLRAEGRAIHTEYAFRNLDSASSRTVLTADTDALFDRSVSRQVVRSSR